MPSVVLNEYTCNYFLWLNPVPVAGRRFSEIIATLSQRYNSRLFDPHITLISGIKGPIEELIDKTHILSKSIPPLTVKPYKISYLDEFYRSLFISITISDELNIARELAINAFGSTDKNEFMPHVSLYYGNLPADEKIRIISELDESILESFVIEDITLFSTSHDDRKWSAVKTFPLTGK